MSTPSFPLLTIAIPTVNRLALMKLALASALAQTIPVGIILSDNGSTDGTKEYLAALSPRSNLRLFRHETTMPVQDHGAFIVSQLGTEWVVFLSDDDSLEPGFAAGVLDAIARHPDAALVYTGCAMTYGDIAIPANTGPVLEPAAGFFLEFMKGRRNICMCATAFRTADWRRIGRQPDSCLIGDMYYWTQILAGGGPVACVAAHLANYSFYRPGVRTETNRISPEAWLRESAQYAKLMTDYLASRPALSGREREIKKAGWMFLALTTANQFVWNALRGANKIDIACACISLASTLGRDGQAIMRASAALLLPRIMLETAVMYAARRRAREATRLN